MQKVFMGLFATALLGTVFCDFSQAKSQEPADTAEYSAADTSALLDKIFARPRGTVYLFQGTTGIFPSRCWVRVQDSGNVGPDGTYFLFWTGPLAYGSVVVTWPATAIEAEINPGDEADYIYRIRNRGDEVKLSRAQRNLDEHGYRPVEMRFKLSKGKVRSVYLYETWSAQAAQAKRSCRGLKLIEQGEGELPSDATRERLRP